MKRYIHTLFAIAAILMMTTLVTGCADDVIVDPAKTSDTNTINIRVSVPMSAAAASRAAEQDEIDLNEFRVQSLHLYFFVSAGHDDATSEYVYDCEVNEPFDVSKTITLAMPANALSDGGIFGSSGTDCIVYAVANVDPGLLMAKTIDGLKASVIYSDFGTTKVQPSFAMDGKSSLSLDRNNRKVTGKIDLTRAAAKLTLAVNVPRSITVEENEGGNVVENTYTPVVEEMRVWMANGVKQSKLNTEPLPVENKEWLYSNEVTVAEGSGSPYVATTDEALAPYNYVQSIPFYSYPNKWEQYDLDGNSYMTLEIPWMKGDNVKVRTFYRIAVHPEISEIQRNTHYDMRVTIGRMGGTSDKPVDMKVQWVYVLPWNDEVLATVIKDIRYLLLNNNYLDPIEQDVYTFEMDNETDIDITFGSSHPVEIAEVKLTWHDFLNDIDRTITLTPDGGDYPYSSTIAGYNPKAQYAGIQISDDNRTLKLHRDMVHIGETVNIGSAEQPNKVYYPYNLTTNPAFNSYRFDIVLRHTDDYSQTAKVRITQIPAIYITSLKTPTFIGTDESGKSIKLFTRFVNPDINDDKDDYKDNKGNSLGKYGQYANPTFNHGTDANPVYRGYLSPISQNPDFTYKDKDVDYQENAFHYYLGTIHDASTLNQNTYVINISRFNETTEDDYIIADPRTLTRDNLSVTGSNPASTADWSMTDGKKRLTYYYPSDGSLEKTRYIAPKFRIASQWGISVKIRSDAAKRRCASYQENGRPAGRWRLPTVAEIEYIARLSNDGYIPYLFGSAKDKEPQRYWCASGAVEIVNYTDPPTVTIVNETDPKDLRSMRCVYDEWYWEGDTLTEANKTKFTWGDRRRSTYGNVKKK